MQNARSMKVLRPVTPCRRKHPAFAVVVLFGVLASGGTSAGDWPLWAYGVTEPPKPGDQAVPQRAPGPWFRPDLPREEQLQPL